MSFIEMILIAVSLASDAFAVSVSKGVSINMFSFKKCIKVSLYFSIFQMLMPLLGFLLGIKYANILFYFSKLIVFILLLFIGVKMIFESRNDNSCNNLLNIKEMVVLSIATSIDALAVGLSFGLLKINVFELIILIGIVTFILCFIGYYIGVMIGDKFRKSAEILGGLILLFVAFKLIF